MRVVLVVRHRVALLCVLLPTIVLSIVDFLVLLAKNPILLNQIVPSPVGDHFVNVGEYTFFTNQCFVDGSELLWVLKWSSVSLPLDSTIHVFLIISFLNLSLSPFFGKMGVTGNLTFNLLLNSCRICLLLCCQCVEVVACVVH